MRKLLPICLLAASCAQTPSPKITLSREKVLDRGHIEMKGTGFTPKTSIISHMKRPDNTQFPGLRIMTDDRGEFTHPIETFTLLPGLHQVWVVDRGGVSSNLATFEVSDEEPKK